MDPVTAGIIAAQEMQSKKQMMESAAMQMHQSHLTHQQTLATIGLEGAKQRENQWQKSQAAMRDGDAQADNDMVQKAGASVAG